MAVHRVQAEALHQHLAGLHHEHHAELLLAAVLGHELLPRHAGLLKLHAQVLHELVARGLVDLIGDAALEAARELAHGHLLHVALVGLALLGLEDAAHIGHQGLLAREHGHVRLHPGIVDDRHDLLLDLLHGHRAGNGLVHHFPVLGAQGGLEGELLGLARLHADERLIESLGHVAPAHEVGAVLAGERLDLLAVVEALHGDGAGVPRRKRLGVGHHVGDGVLGNLLQLLVDGSLVEGEGGHRDLHRLVGGQLVGGLHRDVQGERELLAALELHRGRGLGRERRHEVAAIERPRHEHLDGVGLDDLVQIGDAELFLRQFLDGLARCGTHAHLHGEGLGGLLERVVNLDGRRLAIELDDAVGELLLGYFHGSLLLLHERGPTLRRPSKVWALW